MQKSEEKKPLMVLIDSIAYFLAGNYIIDKSIIVEATNELTSWHVKLLLPFIVGILLALVGLLLLLSVLKIFSGLFMNGPKIPQKLHNFSHRLIICFLFSITSIQVFEIVINHFGLPAFPPWIFILRVVFLIVLLISILYISRKVFATSEGLFYLVISFAAIAFYILFAEYLDNQIIELFSVKLNKTDLQIGLLLILLAVLVLVFAIFTKGESLED